MKGPRILQHGTALTLTQPWATLVVQGRKRIETRGWSTSYRGDLLIHAAKEMPRDAAIFAEQLGLLGDLEHPLPRGAILGTVQVVDCVRTEDLLAAGISARELAVGDYTAGRFGWLLEEPIEWDQPVPMRGQLGLWGVLEIEVADALGQPRATTLQGEQLLLREGPQQGPLAGEAGDEISTGLSTPPDEHATEREEADLSTVSTPLRRLEES